MDLPWDVWVRVLRVFIIDDVTAKDVQVLCVLVYSVPGTYGTGVYVV